MKPQLHDEVVLPRHQGPRMMAIHRDSKVISKLKPNIRIIHVFAPEIIKTDAENFRDLVQRLTGKPAAGGTKENKVIVQSSSAQDERHHGSVDKQQSLVRGEVKKEDEEMLVVGESYSRDDHYFSGSFGDDFIIHDLTDFPFLPFRPSHQVNFPEEMTSLC